MLKPRRGTASVGVLMAHSLPEAREIFGVLSRSAPSVDVSELVRERRVVLQAGPSPGGVRVGLLAGLLE